MHRVVANTPDGMETDHIDGNSTNNQRGNLRVCSRTENAMNLGVRSDNSSGFKGVCWHKATGKWESYISAGKKHIHLGVYHTVEEAAHAYDAAALKYHGPFARLNYP